MAAGNIRFTGGPSEEKCSPNNLKINKENRKTDPFFASNHKYPRPLSYIVQVLYRAGPGFGLRLPYTGIRGPRERADYLDKYAPPMVIFYRNSGAGNGITERP